MNSDILNTWRQAAELITHLKCELFCPELPRGTDKQRLCWLYFP